MSHISYLKFFVSPAVRSSTYEKLSSDHYLHPHDSTLTPHISLIVARTMVISASWMIFTQSTSKMPLIGSLFTALPLAGGWVALEYRFFVQAVRKAALTIFAQQSPVPLGTVTYMGQCPEVIKILIKTPENLTKACVGAADRGQRNLLKTLIRCTGISAPTYEIWLEVFKGLVSAPQALDASDLIAMAIWHPRCALYALEKNLISPQEFSPEDLSRLWRFVSDFEVMRALVAKGFNIKNAARAKLADAREWAPIDFLWRLCEVLSLGAEAPALDEEFKYQTRVRPNDPKGTGKRVTIRESLQNLCKNPDWIAALKQAQEPGELGSIPDEQAAIGTRGPLVNISLTQGKFEVADTILRYRFWVVLTTLSCLALKAFAWLASQLSLTPRIFAQGSCLALLSSGLISWGYYVFESRRAAIRLREVALRAFRQKFPSHSVASFVAQDLPTLQQLSKKQIMKFDDHGYTLWNHLESQPHPNFEIFTNFAEHLCAEAPSRKIKFFFHVVRKGRVKFVHYLLNTNKITLHDIPDQFEVWRYVNDPAVAKFLKSHGFNLEITNYKGQTPLHAALNAEFVHVPNIRALLAAGAKFDKTKVPNFDQLPYQVRLYCLGRNLFS